jgi:hypothetical protein
VYSEGIFEVLITLCIGNISGSILGKFNNSDGRYKCKRFFGSLITFRKKILAHV